MLNINLYKRIKEKQKNSFISFKENIEKFLKIVGLTLIFLIVLVIFYYNKHEVYILYEDLVWLVELYHYKNNLYLDSSCFIIEDEFMDDEIIEEECINDEIIDPVVDSNSWCTLTEGQKVKILCTCILWGTFVLINYFY